MSRHEYEWAIEQRRTDAPFYGLIMAAMLRADTENIGLVAAWPDVHAELDARYWAPGAIILGDPDYDPAIHRTER